jgi:CubicO group peptidase (beta-lactamase class C family)
MKALIRDRFGPPDVLEVRDVPQPVPKERQVLVRVHACSLNDWDWGMLKEPMFPWQRAPRVRILGSDIAGEVAAVGARVERFKVGDHVYGDLCGFGGWGGFAEYVCAAEKRLALKAPRMTFEQAAALPQAGQLAFQALAAAGPLTARRTLLINGAGGGVGTLGVQFAKSQAPGIEVTGVDSGLKLEMMRAIGFRPRNRLHAGRLHEKRQTLRLDRRHEDHAPAGRSPTRAQPRRHVRNGRRSCEPTAARHRPRRLAISADGRQDGPARSATAESKPAGHERAVRGRKARARDRRPLYARRRARRVPALRRRKSQRQGRDYNGGLMKTAVSLLFLLVSATALAQSGDQSRVLDDAQIRAILEERVGDDRDHIGIVIGIIEPQGRRIVAYGSTGDSTPHPVDGDTVFEIGSVTKVFTSLLLADMVERGELALSDPIAKFLPPGVTSPERGGRKITLFDLATHTSGLPRLPTNMTPANRDNPYADYSVEQMYAFLSRYQLPRDIGAQYEYSNYGVGLLGHLLALAADEDYETLIRTRITEPLGMSDTRIALTPDMQSRLAVGHDQRRNPVPNWDLPTLAGAGALRSTANDMLSFLALHLGYTASELSPAAAAMLAERRAAGAAGEIALGWHIQRGSEREHIWHNGGTGGYRSFIGYDPVTRVGVVALTNVSTTIGVDDIGRHLLDPSSALLPADSPLIRKPQERTEISLDADLLQTYVGRYEFGPGMLMTITRGGNQLFGQLTGQGSIPIYPESETEFFMRVVDAQITFRTDTQGRVNALVLHQLGRDQLAQRLDTDADPIDEWFGHKVNPVDPSVYDAYVGEYALQPTVKFTVTREGDRLFVQLTGQPRIEVFAETERNYFYKVVDAQITFVAEDNAPATALVLHQGGRDMRAERIE